MIIIILLIVPEDLDYLPGGSSLPLIYSQLVQYCKNQTGNTCIISIIFFYHL